MDYRNKDEMEKSSEEVIHLGASGEEDTNMKKDQEEEVIEVQDNKNLYQEQRYNNWTQHTVNSFNDDVKDHEEEGVNEVNNDFNINFSNNSPYNSQYTTNYGASRQTNDIKKKNKKKKRTVVAAVLVGMLLLFTVISSSVYVGYALADRIENKLADRNEVIEKEQGQTNNKNDNLGLKVDPVNSQNTSKTVPEIVDLLGPSVVSINTRMQVQNSFIPNYGEGAGSGFVFSETEDRYYIATNNHVIEGAVEVTITLDGEVVPAYLQGTDTVTDLAVIYINKSDLSPKLANYIQVAELGDSEDLVVGELAVALGNPLGLGETVTVGVVSAINREITLENGMQYTLIQTDAAINPGNSGGALANGYGEIVGINTLKIGKTDVEGIGFAIPMDLARPILENIIEKGSIKRPFIGIKGTDVTEQMREVYGFPLGAFVIEVMEGSPADLAGLQPYDLIVKLDGTIIKNMQDLKTMIEGHEVGDKVVIDIIRDGQQLQTTLKLQGQ